MADNSDVALTYGAQLARAEQVLATAGLARPRAEATELLSHLLGVLVPALLALPAAPMRQSDARMYAVWVARRAEGEVLAYITGHLEFMGLDITIGQNGPLTSPGAQRLVETALQWARRRAPGELSAAEVGTGCGAIALALAAFEPRFTRVYAVEPSVTALEMAAANGARYQLNLLISWLAGEGLDSVPEPVDVVVCSHIEPSTPSTARLLELAPAKLRPGGALVCAIDRQQVPEFSAQLERALPTAEVWADFHPEGSVLIAQLPSPWRDTTFYSGNSRR